MPAVDLGLDFLLIRRQLPRLAGQIGGVEFGPQLIAVDFGITPIYVVQVDDGEAAVAGGGAEENRSGFLVWFFS